MAAGSRLLRIDLGGLVKLWSWPVSPEASFRLVGNRLPPDAEFVKVVRMEGPKVWVLVRSTAWEGHDGSELPPPIFAFLNHDKTHLETPPKPEIPEIIVTTTGRTH